MSDEQRCIFCGTSNRHTWDQCAATLRERHLAELRANFPNLYQ